MLRGERTDIQTSGWIFLLLGAATLIQGIRFRSGIGRRNLAENYRDMRVPRLRRCAGQGITFQNGKYVLSCTNAV
jgi:hypothetical protein